MTDQPNPNNPNPEMIERVANDFAVKVIEHAIMVLDADEENTAQIEAFGALVEKEFCAAMQAQLREAQGKYADLQAKARMTPEEVADAHRIMEALAKDGEV